MSEFDLSIPKAKSVTDSIQKPNLGNFADQLKLDNEFMPQPNKKSIFDENNYSLGDYSLKFNTELSLPFWDLDPIDHIFCTDPNCLHPQTTNLKPDPKPSFGSKNKPFSFDLGLPYQFRVKKWMGEVGIAYLSFQNRKEYPYLMLKYDAPTSLELAYKISASNDYRLTVNPISQDIKAKIKSGEWNFASSYNVKKRHFKLGFVYGNNTMITHDQIRDEIMNIELPSSGDDPIDFVRSAAKAGSKLNSVYKRVNSYNKPRFGFGASLDYQGATNDVSLMFNLVIVN